MSKGFSEGSAKALRSFLETDSNEYLDDKIGGGRIVQSLSQIESLAKLSISLSYTGHLYVPDSMLFNLRVLKLEIRDGSVTPIFYEGNLLLDIFQFVSRCCSLNKLELFFSNPCCFKTSSVQVRCPQTVEYLALNFSKQMWWEERRLGWMALANFFSHLPKLKTLFFYGEDFHFVQIMSFSKTLQVLILRPYYFQDDTYCFKKVQRNL
eukprot:TRINITY_DN5046_c0_g1_i5.p1 TRINITY_DN5046_c0_g1~~TRINITY_DN5046_c0_g1_i5.p1  ORF type:complete len:208 (-),score=14.51 TRINITY_DN5046_c0_g1_i5:154-777(-)